MYSFTLQAPIVDSFRVRQVAGMFDLPWADRTIEHFAVELPSLDEAWRIGLIVGPSGSGKTSLARAWLGDRLSSAEGWQRDQAIIDGFGDLPIKRITGMLTAVGFGSPPGWLKPHHVLSAGERFRCDLARALLRGSVVIAPPADDHDAPQAEKSPLAGQSEHPIVVVDEFTSLLDRRVARVSSAAVAKAIRGGLAPARLVAVTCHADVAGWLRPDWLIDMAARKLVRRRLRRPRIQLAVHRCRRDLWPRFARHHYLGGALAGPAHCYLATWRGEPVAFCATLPLIGRRGRWRITRLVTLPDYQGVGIGMKLAEAVGDIHRAMGLRLSVTAGHPALMAHCGRSPRWRFVRGMTIGSRRCGPAIRNYRGSAGRCVASFEYVGPEGAGHVD